MSSFSGMNIIKLFINVVNDSDMLSTSLDMISLLFTQLMFIFMCFVLGLILGYRFDEKKDLKTFLIALVLYLAIHSTMVFIVKELQLDYFTFITLFFGIINIIIYFVSRSIFKKGVNLE